MGSKREHFSNMFYLLNGGDPHEFIQELDYSGEPGSREVLERWGIRWNPLIEQDVNLIWSGYEPKFFMLEDDWAAKYRHNHGVRFVSEEGRFIHGHEFEEMAQELDREIQYEIEQWGIDLWMVRYGYACHSERNFFYKTEEWKNRAAAARYENGYVCQACKKHMDGLHVHHDAPIFSAYNQLFYRNFSPFHLSLFCDKCHENFHKNTVRMRGYQGFVSATPSQVREEKQYFNKWRHVHDSLKTCKFCYAVARWR